jgi:penicillin-binding protein 2
LNLDNRKYVIVLIFIAVCVVFVFRLIYMQGIDETWKERATRITEKAIILKPPRGLIYDRNGNLLVSNQAVYDLMVIPNDISAFDTLALCQLLDITKDEFNGRLMAIHSAHANWQAHVFVSQIKPKEFAGISEQLHKFPGFFGQPGTMRNYPTQIAALVLGDVGKISPLELEREDYYDNLDYIGKGGLERAYEPYLRGTKGIKYFYRDNKGLLQEVAEGRLNSDGVEGSRIVSTLDGRLQEYGELLMQNKKGCIVAIEPSTGEILCLVSSPTYNPNRLVGRERGEHFTALSQDSTKPLYNRAIKGQYRPGSIFKMVQALVALEQGVIKPSTRIRCNRSIIGCHGSHSYDDLEGAIKHSCNPYFRNVMGRMVEKDVESNRFKDARLGLAEWQTDIMKFGFGTNLGTDLSGIKNGQVPGVEYYDAIYGKERWAYSTIYSLSIGEGELLINPLQMANVASIIANKGWYHPPHVVRDIDGNGKPSKFLEKKSTGVSSEHFDVVINAMSNVVQETGGTARRARIDGIEVCGKTGTVQNDPIPDHSVFMAFAPRENPQIAIAVYVEFSGFGGTWAAPIASLMMEQYLNDSISNKKKEDRILEAKFLDY